MGKWLLKPNTKKCLLVSFGMNGNKNVGHTVLQDNKTSTHLERGEVVTDICVYNEVDNKLTAIKIFIAQVM